MKPDWLQERTGMNEYIHKVRNSNRNRNWLLALGISCAAHLPACGVVYNGHHFGGGLFVYLLAKGACLHVAVGLNNVHRAVAAKGERQREREEGERILLAVCLFLLLLASLTWNDNCRQRCP